MTPTIPSRASANLMSRLDGPEAPGFQDPSPLKTTMSPRSMPRMWYTILLTRTRSLTSSVFSIDPEGIQNAWIA